MSGRRSGEASGELFDILIVRCLRVNRELEERWDAEAFDGTVDKMSAAQVPIQALATEMTNNYDMRNRLQSLKRRLQSIERGGKRPEMIRGRPKRSSPLEPMQEPTPTRERAPVVADAEIQSTRARSGRARPRRAKPRWAADTNVARLRAWQAERASVAPSIR